MVFCNRYHLLDSDDYINVTILILIDGFLQFKTANNKIIGIYVTILILIDGFLQYKEPDLKVLKKNSHNPYFNRWFSAMENQ